MAKRGRPTRYKPEFAELAYRFCLLGATDEDLCRSFKVSHETLSSWKKRHPDFLESLKRGKAEADGVIAESLYHRAKGYSHPEEKIFCHEGVVTRVETMRHYPPDTTACIFWLKNRRPDLWRDKVHNEHTTPDGKPLIAVYIPDNGRDKRND